MGAIIKAIEYVYPQKVVTNEDLSKEFPDYDFDKFEKKVGIKERYVVSGDETAMTLAIRAINKLLSTEIIDKNDVDYLLYCTQSPEYFLPSTACMLQDICGFPTNVGALDFNLGCSGYTYGLSIAKGLIYSGQAKNVMLVTAETYSKFINKKDKTNRSIFGDAASATLITMDDGDFLGDFLFGTDGAGADQLIVKNGGARCAVDSKAPLKTYGTNNAYTDNDLYMNGPAIFNFTSSSIPDFTKKVLNKNGIIKEEVNQYIFHQANAFMLNFLRKRIKIEKERFFVDLSEGGNTVSNTIPIALKKYTASKVGNQAESILLMGFGVGLSWCGGLVTIKNKL